MTKQKNYYEMPIDFYFVEMPEVERRSFEAVLSMVDSLAEDSTRNVELPIGPIRLDRLDRRGKYLQGDLSRIKMGQIPSKQKLNGKKTRIALDDDEGIGNETAFVFDPKSNVLAIQRNRSGVSAASFKTYFERAGVMDGPLIMKLCLDPNVLAKLSRIKEVRRLSFRVAGIEDGALLKNLPGGLASLINIRKKMKSPVLELTLSVGTVRDIPLASDDALCVAKTLYEREAASYSQVTSIEVKGVTRDEQSDGVDLIKERLCEVATVQLSKHRRAEYPKRVASVMAAMEKHGKKLKRLK